MTYYCSGHMSFLELHYNVLPQVFCLLLSKMLHHTIMWRSQVGKI